METTDEVQITVSSEDGSFVFTAGGMLDLTNAQELRDGLKDASTTAESITVDFRTASFIDTAVLQYLASAALRMRERGKPQKVIVAEGSYPQRVIRTVGFDQLMEISAEAAI